MTTALHQSRYLCGACGETFHYVADDQEWAEGEFNNHAAQHRVGFCLKCKRWDRWGESCPKCGTEFDIQEEGHQELRHQFIELVLALQDVVPHTNEKKAVQLDPRFWGNEPQAIVKAAINPLFWSNMTTPDVRMAIGMLSSVAGQYGIIAGQSRDAGEEVVVTSEDGGRMLMWKSKKTGQYSKIRDLPSVDGEVTPAIVQTSLFVCEVCNASFTSRIALTGHMRSHK